MDALPPCERGAPGRRRAARSNGGRAARQNRLSVRAAIRPGRRRPVAVAGAAGPDVRPPGRALPRQAPRRHGRRARRGPRDAVLAGRQRPGAVADGRPAGGDRRAHAAVARGRAAGATRLLGTRPGLDRSARQDARRPRHRPGAAHVPRARRRPGRDRHVREADPRGALVFDAVPRWLERAESSGQARSTRRLAAAALEVVDRRRREASAAREPARRGAQDAPVAPRARAADGLRQRPSPAAFPGCAEPSSRSCSRASGRERGASRQLCSSAMRSIVRIPTRS